MVLRFARSLTSLDLHENKINDEAAISIGKGLAFSLSLQTLRVSANKLGAKGAETIFDGCTKNLNLVGLTLEVAGGTSSTGLRLPPLKGLEPAHSLDMGGLRLGPLSAKHGREGLPNDGRGILIPLHVSGKTYS